jgi:hypothetical protein
MTQEIRCRHRAHQAAVAAARFRRSLGVVMPTNWNPADDLDRGRQGRRRADG